MNQKERDQQKACLTLREMIKPGDTVYTKLNHVSKSGMLRVIECMIFRDNAPVNITHLVSDLLDYKMHNKHYGLKVGGCGMDMGFSVVYNLSSALYRSGYECLKPGRCPSNHHVNSRRGEFEPIHHDGYAISQRWI